MTTPTDHSLKKILSRRWHLPSIPLRDRYSQDRLVRCRTVDRVLHCAILLLVQERKSVGTDGIRHNKEWNQANRKDSWVVGRIVVEKLDLFSVF